MQTQARSDHRFTTRRGRLNASIDYKVAPSGLVMKFGINESQAPYGVYQHDGTRRRTKSGRVGGIKPDPFIYRAADKKIGVVRAYVQQALDKIMGGLKGG